VSVRTRRWEPVVWSDTASRAGPDECDRDAHIAALARALDVPPVVARLLCQRGFDTPEAAARFLSPSVDHLHDPFLLTDLGVAVERLLAAVANRERIAIHGDYDVDGVTSTVILRRTLELLGGDVTHFLPERLRDGYGLQPANVDRLHAAGARVIVSVDCGIRSGAAADRARELGLDLIISDHHEPEATLPRALAVINPKRKDCHYPDKHLAGVGVALKIVQGLCAKSGRDKWLPSFLKIAAIGTIADVVPLIGENRVIARLGLERLSKDRHTVGLRALLDGSGLTGKALDSFHIGFLLAPRINAAGRMASPDIAARLLLASDEGAWDEARALAEQLNVENTKRQEEEASIVAEARKLVETDTAGSSASSRRSWSTTSINRPSCCRSTVTTSRARAAASRPSTCWARSRAARICSAATAVTGRRRGCRSIAAGWPTSGPASPASPISASSRTTWCRGCASMRRCRSRP
jgi:single-stranded-DNA-specific exonuclease